MAEPWVVFVVALLVTGGLVFSVANAIRRQDQLAFENEVARSLEAITQRLNVTANLVRGTAGLFEASQHVDAGEFRRYVDALELSTRYPGILGIGYTQRLEPDEVAPFEASMRAIGRTDFRVWPEFPRSEYHSIVYLEPMNRRNAAAIGYDMFTEPVRRAAMQAARERRDLVVSGKVTLVQEIDRNKQAGFLMYLPIYEDGPAGKQLSLQGYVYSPLRVGDLLAGTRGPGAKRIDYVVFDGTRATPDALLRTTIRQADPPSGRFVAERVIEVAGRPWLVRFYSRPELDALSRRWLVPWLALTALAASLLLAYLSWAQGRARRAAESAASEQRRAARTLHREREWLGATLTSIGDGVIAVDADECVTWMNPVAERLTGWSKDEALGRAMRDVMQATPLSNAARTDASLPGEYGHGEAMLHARDGTERPVEHSSAPIRDPHGVVSGAVIVIRDASERYRVEAELRENDRRKDEFLAMLAHELRNPLAPISTAARALRLPAIDGAQVREASAIISRQVAHMTELVDDLLDVSRVTRGLIVLEREVFDLRGSIDAAVEQVRAVIELHRHALEVRIGESPLWVCGDRTRLTQVVANLLDNAAKYTPAGGRITVEARRAEARIRLSVRDTGIGIGPELRSRVFDLFSQGERSIDRSQGGLGIGLALVRGLVALHDGSVDVESAGPGQGSVFVVDLPVAGAAGDASRAPVEEPVRERRALDVAIVDDNDDALQTLAFLLETQGHRVQAFDNAELALQAADDDPAEVYILDIGLPGMSGHELARRLRVHPRASHSVLLALSGYGRASDREASREAGFEVHFVKPVDPDHLLRVLQRVASRPVRST
jgi:PAS domain S-box-containing protein